jgi:hypothetical protein
MLFPFGFMIGSSLSYKYKYIFASWNGCRREGWPLLCVVLDCN